MKLKTFFVIALLTVKCSLFSIEQDEIVTSITFENCADFIIDKTKAFKPENVKDGDIIYVEGAQLRFFFSECHPKITNRYILISHYGDVSVPGKNVSVLDEDKLIAWFGINVENCQHPKMIAIPIGAGITNIAALAKRATNLNNAKKYLLYMNFNINNYPSERRHVQQLFLYKPFCYRSEFKSYNLFIDDIADSKFVLSPRGAGWDCYRTWEAMYINSIPIVKTSPLNSLFDGLPVLIVNRWEEINEPFLNRKYQEMKVKKYNLEKLSAKYWVDQIMAKKAAALNESM